MISYGKSWEELDTWNKLLRDFELEDTSKFSSGPILFHIDIDGLYSWETPQSVRDSIDAEWARKLDLTDLYSIERQKIIALKNDSNVWVMNSNDLSAFLSLRAKRIELNDLIVSEMRDILENNRDSVFLYGENIYLITGDRNQYHATLKKTYNRPAYKFLRDSVYGVANNSSEIPISEVADFFSDCVENYSDTTSYSLSLQKIGAGNSEDIETYIIRPYIDVTGSNFENNFYMLIKRGNKYFLSPIWESYSWFNIIFGIPNISVEFRNLLMDYGDFQWVNMGDYFVTYTLYNSLKALSQRISQH